MYEVVKDIHFSYGHRLIHHKGKCSRYHGHNGIARVTCRRDRLNENGMVVDFDDISQSLKKWIDDHLDHQMILNETDELIPLLKKGNQPFFVVSGEPTAENIAKVIFEAGRKAGLPVAAVQLWETHNSSAIYREGV